MNGISVWWYKGHNGFPVRRVFPESKLSVRFYPKDWNKLLPYPLGEVSPTSYLSVCPVALYSKLLVSSKKRTPLSGAHGFVKMRWLIRRHGHYWPTVLSDCIAHAKSCDACQRYRLSASRLPSYTRLSSLGHFEVGPRNSELIFADMLSENTSQPQYQDGLRFCEPELCCTTSCCDHSLS
uniref:Integrase zinc-binding domain-containing protein n=1 Tax=Vicia faba TaxID=3906 RepID=R4ITY8_VICFA|nr:hypothetical protein [Vicia faba]